MAGPFIAREDLSDYLGQDVTNDAGALIAVDAACEMVRTEAEQSFNAGTSTITLDGTGTDAILLPELPVNSVGTVAIRGSTVDPQFYAVNTDQGSVVRVYSTATVSAQPLFSDDWAYATGYNEVRWPLGRQNIKITYTHGYADADIPRDIRFVALALASRMIVQGPTVSEAVGDASVRYATSSTDLTAGEKNILRHYKPAR